MSVLTGGRAVMGLDVMRAWRATDLIIPTATSLGIPAVFWLQLYGFKEWATAPKGVGR